MKITTLNTILSLSLLAGAAPAVAQMTPIERRAEAMSTQHTLSFLEADDFFGTTVKNANGADIGEVEDFVVDRGSGRISHVVVSHGGLLGFGGDRVAIPLNVVSLKRTTPHVRVIAAFTPEAYDRMDRMNLDDWIDIADADENWIDQIEADRVQHDKVHRADDPYLFAIKSGDPQTFDGRITDVERFETDNAGEQVAVTIESKNGTSRRVIFGPTWYVMGQPTAPIRGNTVSITAYDLPRDSDDRFVARSYSVNGTKAILRDNDGQPRWNTNRYNPESGSDVTGARALTLLSNIIGAEADARAEDAGSIEGAILELNSGRVAMLTLDPDENFLGIGDDLRCVPWPVVSVWDDKVMLDADKDVLTSTRQAPDDITILTRESQIHPIYSAYSVEIAGFEPTSEHSAKNKAKNKSLSDAHVREFVKAWKKGESFTLSGAFREMTKQEVEGHPVPMRTLRIQTNSGTKTVVLGPSWFVDQQPWSLSKGQQLKIEGKMATFKGETHHFARKIHLPGNHGMILFWDGDSPRWTTN